MNLLPKLEQLEKRHIELEGLLGLPNATDDMDKFTQLNKEYAELTPVVEAFILYRDKLNECEDLKAIVADGDSDPEMKAMASDELQSLNSEIPQLEEQLKIKLLPKDDADDKNVIIEVRAGTGGDEAALFAADIFRMYARFAELQGWKVNIMEQSPTPIGGYKEIVASISGTGVYSKLKFESGTHRVQRVPNTETQGRIHTSAITVAILPEAEEVDVKLENKDLRIDTYRAQGAGGQHVNTTDSAVRITHVPTGIVVQCQDESSQHKNKATAMKILLAKMFDAEKEKADKERSDSRKSQVGSGDRSERIRTYNYPQSRVTDHRVNLTLHNLAEIIAGDGLAGLIEALITENQARRLAALNEEAAA